MDQDQQFASVSPTEDEMRAEWEALGRIVHAFRGYEIDGEWEIKRWEYNFSRLPDTHKALLSSIPTKIAAARDCVHQNHIFLKAMLKTLTPGFCPEAFAAGNEAADEWSAKVGGKISPEDADKVRYVLKNMMRDWSADGAAERAASYGRITIELKRLFPTLPPASTNPSPELQNPSPSVLVPGCGLGRLVAEIAGLGFNAVGCEFSYYMLIASSFILNHTQRAEQWTLHPWVLGTCNHFRDADQLRSILVPDIEPAELVMGSSSQSSGGSMGMCAGDFVEVFGKGDDYRHEFDAIATCFFIDTANNVIEYLETIWKCLKPGGCWINIGPLMWHWADSHKYLAESEPSIEICMEDVVRVAKEMGFKFVTQEQGAVPYMSDGRSMLKQEYTAVFWSAQKPLGDGPQAPSNGV